MKGWMDYDTISRASYHLLPSANHRVFPVVKYDIVLLLNIACSASYYTLLTSYSNNSSAVISLDDEQIG